MPEEGVVDTALNTSLGTPVMSLLINDIMGMEQLKTRYSYLTIGR